MNLSNPFRSFASNRLAVVLTCLGLVAGIAAINHVGMLAEPAVVHAAGNLADGWSVHADSGAGADNKLTMEGAAFHFVTAGPPSNNGTYFNPAWTATGNHTFSATLTQNVKATHPDAYGLVIGGANLADDSQTYT